MNYGLRDEDLSYTGAAYSIRTTKPLFLPRAMNTYRAGSDVDLAILEKGVNFTTISELKGVLEDQSPNAVFVRYRGCSTI